MLAGQRPLVLAALALVLAACVRSQIVIKAIVDAKVDVAQSAKSAFEDKFEAHQALAKAVKSAFSPSPSSPSPQASRPSPGIIGTKVQVLTDLAQASVGKCAPQCCAAGGGEPPLGQGRQDPAGIIWGPSIEPQVKLDQGLSQISSPAFLPACLPVDEVGRSSVAQAQFSAHKRQLGNGFESAPSIESKGDRAWSQERGQPVRGLMWCPVVAPRRPPQAPRSSQAATQPAASEPGPSTPQPAKRSKRIKAKQAAEPTKGKGKAAKAKPAPQPGRWLDRDCNAALNMQRIGESRWRPLELCFWPEQGALPAKGKEYPGLGYKRLRDKPPKAQQQQQQPAEAQ
ncbi:hypothetical protein QJQ45_011505 [Haematococcus lacustris]|nr:hypothetical protein QJQ45_011505 [Haematococcus lacustris]